MYEKKKKDNIKKKKTREQKAPHFKLTNHFFFFFQPFDVFSVFLFPFLLRAQAVLQLVHVLLQQPLTAVPDQQRHVP